MKLETQRLILRKLGFEKTSEFDEPDGICFWYVLNGKNFTH